MAENITGANSTNFIMTTRHSYLLLVLPLFWSCDNISSTPDKDWADENEVINIVIDATLGHDSIWTKHINVRFPFPLPPGELTTQDKIEHEKYIKYADSVKARLDTATLFVFLTDSIIKFPENRNIKSMLEPVNYKANFPDVDSSYRPLIFELVDFTSARHLDISVIKSKFKYKLDYSRNRKKYAEDIIVIGKVTISRVVFNSTKTKACVYSEIVCGELCGSGSILFLTKQKGVWTINGQRELWVS